MSILLDEQATSFDLMSDYNRPSPDALLASTQRECSRGGRLKIFLGAAPGVGKTYEMLLDAQSHRAKGDDVLVGVVETHGRAETQALLDGLHVIPRRTIEYKGRILDEMDVDAVLARRPQLVLVDELAHTNAPGSRHPKRYLDVEELLDAGIDVNTTLNIQHVESLNDVVAQITRIRVRETVPDSIIDRADDIELIDITPDDLIQRMKEGKIYVPKQAERAVRHYFSPGNLTALRELALRQTAQRVDDQLLTHMKAHAIAGPWGAGDRVLVCISEDPRSAGLVRYAKRLADRLHAPWTALSIEGPRALSLSEEERDRLAEVSRLAQQLGGEAVTVPALTRRLAEDVIDFAQANNITHVVIGKSNRSRWFEIVHGSVVHDLVRRSGAISVHVIAGEQLATASTGKKKVQSSQRSGSVRSDPVLASPSRRCGSSGGMRRPQLYCGGKRRARIHNCDRRGGNTVWSEAVSACCCGSFTRLQFLLHPTNLHVHHYRFQKRRRTVFLRARWRCLCLTWAHVPVHRPLRFRRALEPRRRFILSAGSFLEQDLWMTFCGPPRIKLHLC